MGNLIDSVLDHIDRDNSTQDDYRDESGLLMCAICHTRKQMVIELGECKRTVHISCECERVKKAEADKQWQDEQNKRYTAADQGYNGTRHPLLNPISFQYFLLHMRPKVTEAAFALI